MDGRQTSTPRVGNFEMPEEMSSEVDMNTYSEQWQGQQVALPFEQPQKTELEKNAYIQQVTAYLQESCQNHSINDIDKILMSHMQPPGTCSHEVLPVRDSVDKADSDMHCFPGNPNEIESVLTVLGHEEETVKTQMLPPQSEFDISVFYQQTATTFMQPIKQEWGGQVMFVGMESLPVDNKPAERLHVFDGQLELSTPAAVDPAEEDMEMTCEDDLKKNDEPFFDLDNFLSANDHCGQEDVASHSLMNECPETTGIDYPGAAHIQEESCDEDMLQQDWHEVNQTDILPNLDVIGRDNEEPHFENGYHCETPLIPPAAGEEDVQRYMACFADCCKIDFRKITIKEYFGVLLHFADRYPQFRNILVFCNEEGQTTADNNPSDYVKVVNPNLLGQIWGLMRENKKDTKHYDNLKRAIRLSITRAAQDFKKMEAKRHYVIGLGTRSLEFYMQQYPALYTGYTLVSM